MAQSVLIRLAALIAVASCAAVATGRASLEDIPSTESELSPAQVTVQTSTETRKALTEMSGFDACDAWQPAIEILKAAYDAGGRDADLFEELAALELKAGLAAASKHLDEARSLYPSDARFILWSAVAASAAKDDSKAVGLLAEGLKAAGEDEVALYDMAERFLRRGALSVAALVYRRINEVYPKDSMFDMFSVLHLASYYGLIQRYKEASEILKANRMVFEYAEVGVLTTPECDYIGECFAGLAAIKAGDSAAGLDILRNAAARFPRGLVADGEIVKALDAAGKKEEADGVYAIVSRLLNEAIGKEPEKAEAWYNLAFFVAAAGRKNDEGLRAAQWALRLAPLRPDYLATRAAILEVFGKYDEALVAIQRAMVLVSVPRWMDPGEYDEMMWRRLDLLEKTGKAVPAAFRRLPGPATAPSH